MCTGAHIMPVCCLLMSHECPAEEKVLDESIKKMADGVGFEPTRRFHVCRFSRPVPSTARPPILMPFNYRFVLKASSFRSENGGWGGIRTHETLSRLPVFKTGAFNRSATHPHAFQL